MSAANCRCGHSRPAHERPGLEPQCVSPGCACLQYRAPVSAPAPAPKTAIQPVTFHPVTEAAAAVAKEQPTIEHLIAAGRRSDSKRIAALAGKIDDLVAGLREQIRHETEVTAAREEIAALEAKLAKAKQKIARPTRPRRTAPERPDNGVYACPNCGDTFTTPQGRGSHRARAHGFRRAAS